MKIDDKLVDKLAEITMLEFSGKEREKIKADLERITSFMDILNEVDTEGVEPLIYVNEDETNVPREDVPVQTLTREEAFSNAPLHDSDYFKVPKFVTRKS